MAFADVKRLKRTRILREKEKKRTEKITKYRLRGPTLQEGKIGMGKAIGMGK